MKVCDIFINGRIIGTCNHTNLVPHGVFQSDKERECASKAAAEVEERSRALKNKTM
jgi:hypothetical protein